MSEMVPGENPKTVADLVIEVFAELKLDVHRLLLGAFAVQLAAAEEHGLAGRLARNPGDE